MREVGAEVEAIAVDVTATEGAEALISGAVVLGVDILVNNVGGSVWTPFAEITDDEWNHVLNLSFMSAVRVSRAAFPKWKSVVEEHRQHLVNFGRNGAISYSTAKSAMINMSSNLAIEGPQKYA